ncbi:unnamed protein product [Tenebrio molitor]|nr:unnamed protein product [Tenebrio molitor]
MAVSGDRLFKKFRCRFREIYQIRKIRWNGQVSQWCLHDATKMKFTVQRGKRIQIPDNKNNYYN